jgi:hypothetical protein
MFRTVRLPSKYTALVRLHTLQLLIRTGIKLQQLARNILSHTLTSTSACRRVPLAGMCGGGLGAGAPAR